MRPESLAILKPFSLAILKPFTLTALAMTHAVNNEDRKLENVIDPKLVAKAFREIEPFGSTP